MSKNKVFIVHYQPIEKYPPLQNLINYISKSYSSITLFLITTFAHQQLDVYLNNKADIFRIKIINNSGFYTIINLLKFTFFTVYKLVKSRPNIILYYESISSFPVFIYSLFFKKTDIFIHYHEYTTKNEYKSQMKSVYIFNLIEKFIYKKSKWISHTNLKRLELFAKDNGFDIRDSRLNVLPNYPPKAWQLYNNEIKKIDSENIRFVYVGSLSMINMYTKELFDWIESNKGWMKLDIYPINLYDDVIEYLNLIKAKYIFLNNSVSYGDLPTILRNYDVGLIIYKNISPNYIYNAPNKLFEYVSCGLDVWFSSDLLGSYPLISENSVPKILKVNFRNLKSFDIIDAINRDNLSSKTIFYSYEETYDRLIARFNSR